jgi:hypothetical protein
MTNETSFWRSTIVKYAIVSAINLAILLVGIAIGVLLAPHIEKRANAAPSDQASRPPVQNTTTTPADEPYEDVTPMLTAASMAANTFLAHRIATDQLMVNGYDLLALQDGILNVLKNKNIVSYRDLDALVERAKVARPLRLKLAQPQPQPLKPEEKKP